MKDTKHKLSSLTIALHWIIGITIIVMLALGKYMESFEAYALYDIHKSIGMIIIAFVLVRVFWRILNGWPEPASNYSSIERLTAKVVHWILIIGTVALPVSGVLMSGSGGHGLAIFGWELLAENIDPNNLEEVIPLNKTLAGLGHEIHEIVGNIMIIAIVLHLLGALKHHIIDKDGTLRRMLGKSL
jgi:cytochrome b561